MKAFESISNQQTQDKKKPGNACPPPGKVGPENKEGDKQSKARGVENVFPFYADNMFRANSNYGRGNRNIPIYTRDKGQGYDKPRNKGTGGEECLSKSNIKYDKVKP